MRLGALMLTLLLVTSVNPGTEVLGRDASAPFSHVMIIMQENHSFDNYFGTYPTGNGTVADSITLAIAGINGIPTGTCLPYLNGCVSPRLSTSANSENPVEGQSAYEGDYTFGSGFPRSSGPQSMVYFDYHSLAAYWDYAEEYGLADNYFAAALSQTTPNRLLLLAGDTPVSSNYGPPPYISYNRTIFGQLDSRGIKWGYFDLINKSADPASFYPLNYIRGIESARGSIGNISDLLGELGSGTGLPSVSYVSFLGNLKLTEHPPFSPAAGEAQVVSIVNSVMTSAYWNSTVIFITWDEGGGYYDHVVPPSLYSIDHGFNEPLRALGQRVPLIVISPYSKINHVSHLLLSHLSLLRFIEVNWNLPPLNSLVGGATLPTDFFDFSQEPRPKLVLGPEALTASGYPIPLQNRKASSVAPWFVNADLGVLGIALIVLVLFVASSIRSRLPRGESAGGHPKAADTVEQVNVIHEELKAVRRPPCRYQSSSPPTIGSES